MLPEMKTAVQTQTATHLQNATELLARWLPPDGEPFQAEAERRIRVTGHGVLDALDLVVPADQLLAAVEALFHGGWGYLAAITGVDQGEEIEALYQFCEGAAVVNLSVKVGKETAVLPSICPVIPSASFYERELGEMFGITLLNAPNSDRLFLPDEWPEGLYPLRKEFAAEQLKTAVVPPPTPEESNGKNGQPEKFIIPIGPQHPALKEPGHFEFAIDGEVVTGATVRLGYVHRGIEKGAEARNWFQTLYLVERICGICSHIHALTYTLGVEKLAQVEAPPRAQAIRVLVAELERIHSHLLWFGVAAHEAGFDTLFMYSWRDRETIMDILEALTGNRVNYSANVLGGVKFDVPDEQRKIILDGIDFLEKRTHHYLEVVTSDGLFLQRTRGIGVTRLEDAKRLGIVGPTGRASGVLRDVRVDAPYAAYDIFPIQPVVETAGDLEARFVVRLKELFESYRLIRDILDNLPPGDLQAKRFPRRIKPGEVVSRVEAPRGEVFYYIRSNGGEQPERVKVRTPTLCNMASVLTLAVGHNLADVPMLLVGIDPCFSCNDRAVNIKPVNGDADRWTWERLRQFGITYYANRRNE